MKKIFPILIIAFLAASCEDNYLIPDSEVPGWLKEKIENDEATIRQYDERSGLEMSAWIRYTYEETFYFEYENILSSTYPCGVYNYKGTEVFTDFDDYLIYEADRTDKQYVWKGPGYYSSN